MAQPIIELESKILPEQKAQAEAQILANRQVVDFDTNEPSVELLVRNLIRPENPDDLKDDSRIIYIPSYQRKFVWNPARQSKFIESLILGLPIPFMFMADTPEGKWEVVDGSQRLQTLNNFLSGNLELSSLDRLSALNGFRFDDLPLAQQRKFKNRTIRLIVLSDKITDDVRKEIFERINTGSDALREMEIRKGAFSGPFYDFIAECSRDEKLILLCPLSKIKVNRREREELVLRFFCYSEKYLDFRHEVQKFLDEYLKHKNLEFDKKLMRTEFMRMVDFVEKYFPYGFRKTKNAKSTPRVRFEAISVGVNLALREKPDLVPLEIDWLDSPDFKKLTTSDASNSSKRLQNRIEYVRDQLLNSQ